MKRFNELFSILEIVARISIFFTKLSILLLYIRYFCPSGARRNWIYWSTIAVILFNALYCIALVLVVRLQCVGKTKAVADAGECVNHYLVLVTASTINVLTDVLILLIPMAAVSRLRMPQRRKLGMLVIFAVGGLGCAASVARLGYQVVEASNRNQTAVLTNVAILALAEHVIGIVVGCMPLFPALYRHVRRDPGESAKTARSQGNSRWKRTFGRQQVKKPDPWGSISALADTELAETQQKTSADTRETNATEIATRDGTLPSFRVR
ncbi:hypothetical protein HIM_05373 [Hirsutella minnesotensis 3608]|uniref:Rhodopsin domain-containing protein n=1 Tax=Hirsutella minnesotensis 3608 TaxID=1043627 RepID=A0A0F8A5E3_9HYPO|nr:hypothetical protein HIM_05373 [Hirsutella minnesotensis 3608]